jgi:hypothetical protein
MWGVNQTRTAMRLLLFLVCASLLVNCVWAANTTVESYIVHNEPYTPYPVFILTLGLGMMFLILSLILTGEQNNDAFAALAIIPLFAASWMALQLDFQQGGVAGTITDSVFRSDHHIYPSTILALVIFSLGVVSIFQLYRLITQNRIGENYDQGYYAADDE